MTVQLEDCNIVQLPGLKQHISTSLGFQTLQWWGLNEVYRAVNQTTHHLALNTNLFRVDGLCSLQVGTTHITCKFIPCNPLLSLEWDSCPVSRVWNETALTLDIYSNTMFLKYTCAYSCSVLDIHVLETCMQEEPGGILCNNN